MNCGNDEDWGHHKCHLDWKQANPEVVEKSQRDDNRPRNIDVSKTKSLYDKKLHNEVVDRNSTDESF